MTMTNDVRRLAYIEIEAKDLQAWRTFAQDVLCAQVVPGDSPDTLLLRMDDRVFRVALKQGPMDDICALGLELDNQQAFERTRNALQAAGHLPVMATQEQRVARGVTELMTTTDPAGLSVEFSYGAFARPQTPFHAPRAHAGFVTGDQGLGHVLLSVSSSAVAILADSCKRTIPSICRNTERLLTYKLKATDTMANPKASATRVSTRLMPNWVARHRGGVSPRTDRLRQRTHTKFCRLIASPVGRVQLTMRVRGTM